MTNQKTLKAKSKSKSKSKSKAKTATKVKAKTKTAKTKTAKTKTASRKVPAASRSVIPPSVKKGYGKGQNNGDEVSRAIADLVSKFPRADRAAVVADIGKKNGVDVDKRWGHLNPGMRRMNLGNVLRHMSKEGLDVQISTSMTPPKSK